MELTVRPSLKCYPITMAYLAIMFFILFSGSLTAGSASMFYYAILPVLLLLVFQIFGTSYSIKNGVLTVKKWSGQEQTLDLNAIQGVELKPIAFGAGHVFLSTPSGKFTLKNIPKIKTIKKMIERS